MTAGLGKAVGVMTKTESPIQLLLSMFIKSGPWAVMALTLVLGFGYEMHRLVGTVGTTVSAYVIQSGKNNETLVEAMKRVELDHKVVLSSLKVLQDSSDRVNQAVLLNETKLREIQLLIDEAKRMMASVPQERSEQVLLLQKIESAIRDLGVQITNQGKAEVK